MFLIEVTLCIINRKKYKNGEVSGVIVILINIGYWPKYLYWCIPMHHLSPFSTNGDKCVGAKTFNRQFMLINTSVQLIFKNVLKSKFLHFDVKYRLQTKKQILRTEVSV